MSMMKPFSITLTVAQLRAFRKLLREASAIGDCRRRGLVVYFDDYEGAGATLEKVRRAPASARSAASVVNKMYEGIRWGFTPERRTA
jgi:hypothetical protein